MGFWENKVHGSSSAPVSRKPLPPMPGTSAYPPSRPTPPASSKDEGRCPECGGPNYGSPTNSTAARCFDCNFGSSYRNSTDNQAVVRSEGAVKASKQIPDSGYHPNEIVGRIN